MGIGKYTQDGAVEWFARAGGTLSDPAQSVSTDSDGNIYVTGEYQSNPLTIFNANGTTFGTLPNSGDFDVAILKYAPTGNAIWAARMSGTLGDIGRGISVDRFGNVYVGGAYSYNSLTIFNANGTTFGTLPNSGSSDGFVVKYDTNGTAQWAARVSGTGTDSIATASVDNVGNVFVIGSYSSNPLTIFNANGTTFGTLPNSGSNDVLVVKYDTNGSAQWATRVSGTGNDFGWSGIVDRDGNIYISGSYSASAVVFNANGTTFTTLPTSVGSDGFIVKYDTSGSAQWAARVSATGNDQLRGLSTDTNGNVYATGQYNGPLTIFNANGTPFITLPNLGTGDVALIKYDPNGNVIWATRVSGSSSESSANTSTDSSGNVYLTGSLGGNSILFNSDGSVFSTIPGGPLFVKYDANGRGQWYANITSFSANGVATSGLSVYVVGAATLAVPAFVRSAGL
jgi:hypothetical protein